jgi:hypothetical protein
MDATPIHELIDRKAFRERPLARRISVYSRSGSFPIGV